MWLALGGDASLVVGVITVRVVTANPIQEVISGRHSILYHDGLAVARGTLYAFL